jgi:recombination protein RecT
MAAPATTAESIALAQTEKGKSITNRQAFEAILTNQLENISKVAAKHISAPRLISIAVGAAQRQPLLFKCEASTVVRCLLQAAELGLEVGALNEAYLIPFKNGKTGSYECQLMIDYRGYLKLCWQSGLVASIDAGVVYTTDSFTFRKGTSVEILYEPNIDAKLPTRFWPDDQDPKVENRWDLVRCVYAAAKLTTGGTVAIVLTRSDVERYRSRSKAKDSNFWINDWEPMAVKTALKRLQNLLPKSTQMAQAVAVDNQSEFGNVEGPIGFEIPEAEFIEEAEEADSGMKAAKASLKSKVEGEQGALVS